MLSVETSVSVLFSWDVLDDPNTRVISSRRLFSVNAFDPQLTKMEQERLSAVTKVPMNHPTFNTVVKTAMIKRIRPLAQDRRIPRQMVRFLATLTQIRAVVTWNHHSDIRSGIGQVIITIDPRLGTWSEVQPQIEEAFMTAFGK